MVLGNLTLMMSSPVKDPNDPVMCGSGHRPTKQYGATVVQKMHIAALDVPQFEKKNLLPSMSHGLGCSRLGQIHRRDEGSSCAEFVAARPIIPHDRHCTNGTFAPQNHYTGQQQAHLSIGCSKDSSCLRQLKTVLELRQSIHTKCNARTLPPLSD